MFNLTVTEDEIHAVHDVIKKYVYPEHISSIYIAWKVFHQESFEGAPSEITLRKVRLCIIELRKRGVLIIAKRGYSLAGDDPEAAIHFVNGLYSRAHNLTKEADIMYGLIMKKYGINAAMTVKMKPDQPAFEGFIEPAFQKEYDADGTLHNV